MCMMLCCVCMLGSNSGVEVTLEEYRKNKAEERQKETGLVVDSEVAVIQATIRVWLHFFCMCVYVCV